MIIIRQKESRHLRLKPVQLWKVLENEQRNSVPHWCTSTAGPSRYLRNIMCLPYLPSWITPSASVSFVPFFFFFRMKYECLTAVALNVFHLAATLRSLSSSVFSLFCMQVGASSSRKRGNPWQTPVSVRNAQCVTQREAAMRKGGLRRVRFPCWCCCQRRPAMCEGPHRAPIMRAPPPSSVLRTNNLAEAEMKPGQSF